ncbi:hypothetical protein [Corallococcus sp. CA049B]|uniref:hypothetical protein n=1 Tax=Corallococcus sp. CA049B TaxID=2316730 RepID=UPI0013156A9E|nr:hypothetical protein [Corallococcus sp. CA049B]
MKRAKALGGWMRVFWKAVKNQTPSRFTATIVWMERRPLGALRCQRSLMTPSV